MAGIPVWERLAIWIAARRDVAAMSRAGVEKPLGDPFPGTAFLIRLVGDYIRDCQKTLRRGGSVQRFYFNLNKEYETLKGVIDASAGEIRSLEERLEKAKAGQKGGEDWLEELQKQWAEANQTGVVNPETGVNSLIGLTKLVEDAKGQLDMLKKGVSSLNTELANKRRERDIKLKAESLTFYKYLYPFARRCKKVCRRIQRLEARYERKLDFYWVSLARRAGLASARTAGFQQLCEARGTAVMREEDVFRAERDVINKVMRPKVGFELEV